MKLLILSFLLLSSKLFASDCIPMPDSNAKVLHCVSQLSSYPRPVHFYIPKNLNGEGSVSLFIHFHGHNLEGWNHFNPKFGDYGQYLIESKASGALVIPESLGNCKTYDQFFIEKSRADLFISEVESIVEELAGSRPNSLHLSGHSGAYRVLNRLIEYYPQVESLGLFDATYGAVPNIVKWVKQKSQGLEDFLFFNAYVEGPRATALPGSLFLKKEFLDLNQLDNQIVFIPVSAPQSESVLDQHFNLLKRSSLAKFFEFASRKP